VIKVDAFEDGPGSWLEGLGREGFQLFEHNFVKAFL